MKQQTFQPALLAAFSRYANSVAISEGGQATTYNVLEKQFACVAVSVMDSTGGGEAVGILADSRTALVASIAGISLSGNVFVPLDTNLPAQRLVTMMQVAGIKTLICQSTSDTVLSLRNLLRDEPVRFLEWTDMIKEAVATPDYPSPSPDDTLYIYFTSGSTGLPKAVAGRNASLIRFLDWEINEFAFPAGSRFSQLVNPGFDAFLRDVFVPLLSGGTVVAPANPSDLLLADELSRWIDEERIEYIHCVPSVFRLLNRKLENSSQYSSLKGVFLSGEKIHPGELKNWFSIMGSRVRLYNFYGTTETTLIRSFYAIAPEDTLLERLPVGTPIADTRLYVLDGENQPCAVLEEGDVYISSPFVTKGYFSNGQADDSIFQKDNNEPGYLLYRTGDRGRFLENGLLDITGRADEQIKIRGVRIGPGEVESCLLRVDGVQEAAVFKTIINEEEVLGAAVVSGDANVDEETLSAFLAAHLPAGMVPGKWLFVQEFPKLSNGKLDRAALAELKPAIATADTAPANETEQAIYDIWSGIIKNTGFGKQHTFFETGGNSFHLISLVAKVHSRYNIRLSIKDIFQHNSVEKLAAFISGKNEAGKTVIPKAPPSPYYNLSGGQFQVFHQQYLYEGATTYNLPQFFIINGEVDVERMKQSLEKLVAHHATLRTGYTLQDDIPVQFVADRAVPAFEYADQTGISETEEQALMHAFVRPFDLAKPPLFRAKLVKRSADSYLLMTDVHHIAADGFSQMIMNRDLALLYEARALPVASLHYTDYAEWQHKERHAEKYGRQKEYWIKELTPVPRKILLPVNRLSVEESNQEGSLYTFTIDRETTTAIKKLVKQNDTTLFVFLMAVYNILLGKISMQDDIAVGTAVDGRTHPDLQNIVGMFVNTLIVRNRVAGGEAFDSFLHSVKSKVMGALDNQDLPYEEVVNSLKASHTVRNGLFNVMLVYLNMEVPMDTFDEKTVYAYPYQVKNSKFDMTMTGFETHGEIRMKVEYSTELFFEEQIRKIAAYFLEIVQQVLQTPDMPVRDIVLRHNLEAISYEVKSFEFNF